ncbi:FHA domain-containing protein [Nocardioides caeni]|uniref:FHA domain-containing protein n=1 Tax=Nocardioides caeni TaxID=574700 RepID=A0A4S8N219_9ACTN|nr:FHA domain-containing protein [Nocardioides caeni]THV09950.1 FHA domain-containing protein [Nocardioides caeni]
MSARPVAQWSTGPHHGVIWESGLALVSGDLPLTAANQLWARLADIDDLGEFVTALADVAGSGLLVLPDFAVAVIREHGDLHVAARGRLVVVADVPGEAVVVDGSPVETWTERQVAGAMSVSLQAPGASEDPTDLRLGASGVLPAGTLRTTLFVGPVTVPVGGAVPAFAARQHASPDTEAAPPSPGADHPLKAATLFPDDDIDPATPIVPPEVAAPATSSSPPSPPLSPPSMRGPMWGAPPPAPVPSPDGVLAVLCANGHANPPQRPRCRSCGGELDGPPRQVPRPSLGRLSTTSAGTIELTAPVVIGRAPRTERFQGPEMPRLLVLTEPHISATHLALRIDGWSVLAEDLGSTNGTYVRRHGQQPFRLVGQPHPLAPGDVIDLGHGVQLHFEELP